MSDIIEKEAPSVDEAVFAACMSLGIDEKDAQIQVLAKGGSGRAKVRVGKPGAKMPEAPSEESLEALPDAASAEATTFEKPSNYSARASKEQPSEEELSKLVEQMTQLLEKMGCPSEIEVKEKLDNKVINIKGEFEGLLIGKRGQTLESLQEMARRFLESSAGPGKHVVIDVADYRGKREDELLQYAKDLAEQAQEAGQVTSKPLPPAERRVVHMSLKAEGSVETWSVGDGAMKKVVVQKRA